MNKLFFLLRRFEKYRNQVVFELLENGERMLDVACGNGGLVLMAAKKFREVYGVDISSERILKAKKQALEKNLKNFVFKRYDVDNGLPFEDKYFDSVTAVAALAFFFDPYFVMHEFHRVLRRKGILIIEVPNLAYLPRRLNLIFGKLPKVSFPETGWDGGHLHYFTQGSLRKLLEDSGFEIIQITGSGIFANFRNWWPSLLCGNIIIKAVKK